MKVLIIEDEAPAFRRLQKILDEIDRDIEIIDVVDSVEDSVKWLGNHESPDLIFMDIQLSDGVSFDIFDQIDIRNPVIFTTAFDEYMLHAFKVNSIDYLLKPIKKEELEKSLVKYDQMKQIFSGNNGKEPSLNELIKSIKLDDHKYKTRFLIKKGEKLISIPTDDIALFYTRNGVVHLLSNSGNDYLMDHNLEEICDQLDPEKYFRANRQYVISFVAIREVHKWTKGKLLIEPIIELDEQIIVSAEKAGKFKEWLGEG
ncbi:LytR/AlgR family response regulator transcription factor [Marinigracilibium pacificum]|uniref:Response regulator transcription factor n=1 Tax=Marinigracilibium pacificum TaxID=2729599 RepID=A0A848IW88_9BACT|nr:LytTR family DNA-binding domain-containing protein [Marinigracilibium pacificum]NMM47511.1 response regulator transcription factor [Marinigracilibium pacificum]